MRSNNVKIHITHIAAGSVYSLHNVIIDNILRDVAIRQRNREYANCDLIVDQEVPRVDLEHINIRLKRGK